MSKLLDLSYENIAFQKMEQNNYKPCDTPIPENYLPDRKKINK